MKPLRCPTCGQLIYPLYAGDICDAVAACLQNAERPPEYIGREKAFGGGRLIADMFFISGNDISGVEIKSSRDSAGRLKAQVKHYAETFDFCHLATDDVDKYINHVPEWWGVLKARQIAGGEVEVIQFRKADPSPDKKLSSLLSVFWKYHLAGIVKKSGLPKSLCRMTKGSLIELLQNRLPADFLKAEALKFLKRNEAERPKGEQNDKS